LLEFIRKYWIYIGVVIYYFFQKDQGTYTVDKALLNSIFAIMLYWLNNNFWVVQKYRTSFLVGDGVKGSNYTPTRVAGAWAIDHLGDIELFGIRGKDATVIYPKEFMEKRGENKVVHCRFIDITEYKSAVPTEVFPYINTREYGGSIYLGLPLNFESRFESNKQALDTFYSYLNNNVLENEKDLLIKGRYDLIENGVEHSARIVDRARHHPLKQFISSMNPFKGKDDNE
jgi:hypothetical protein